MSRAKRKKQFVAQQKAAGTIAANGDLKKGPLTGSEILALPRSERRYPKRRTSDWGSGSISSGSSGVDFVGIIGFLILWAVCAFVLYFVYTSLGMTNPFNMIVAIISGLLGAMMIHSGATGGVDVTHWW